MQNDGNNYVRQSNGEVAQVVDWPFSTFYRDVTAELFPMDWGGTRESLDDIGIAGSTRRA
jgi:hypothetical protein